jgi:hypothetical protein
MRPFFALIGFSKGRKKLESAKKVDEKRRQKGCLNKDD